MTVGMVVSALQCLEPQLGRVKIWAHWTAGHWHLLEVSPLTCRGGGVLSAGPQLVLLTTVLLQGLSLWLGLSHSMAASRYYTASVMA